MISDLNNVQYNIMQIDIKSDEITKNAEYTLCVSSHLSCLKESH